MFIFFINLYYFLAYFIIIFLCLCVKFNDSDLSIKVIFFFSNMLCLVSILTFISLLTNVIGIGDYW